jgi:hypothetical protein
VAGRRSHRAESWFDTRGISRACDFGVLTIANCCGRGNSRASSIDVARITHGVDRLAIGINPALGRNEPMGNLITFLHFRRVAISLKCNEIYEQCRLTCKRTLATRKEIEQMRRRLRELDKPNDRRRNGHSR